MELCKLVAAGKDIKLYDGAYTKIVLDNSDVQLVANVKIAGKVEGYESGDKVTMSIDGVEYAATVDANGNFYCSYSPVSPETIKVKAHLDRDSETLVATETTVDIVNEYSDLPQMYIENQLNILGKAELKDEEGNAIWGSSNRLTSVAVAEVGEKTFAYAGSKNGLAVFDITTPSTPVLVETYNIAVDDVNTFNKLLDVYNGYLITANIGETSRKIEFYQIGSDGKLAAEPTSSILDEVIPYLDGGEGTLYEHILLGLKRIACDKGSHGLPLFGGGDWNDSLNRVGEKGIGESVWLAQFIYYCINEIKPLLKLKNDDKELAELTRIAEEFKEAHENVAWDEDWYIIG